MSQHDLLAGVIAAQLRLLPEVQQLFPPRPDLTRPTRTAAGLLAAISDEPPVTITGDGTLEIEASIAVAGATTALHGGREAIAAIAAALPHGVGARIRVRVATID